MRQPLPFRKDDEPGQGVARKSAGEYSFWPKTAGQQPAESGLDLLLLSSEEGPCLGGGQTGCRVSSLCLKEFSRLFDFSLSL